MGSSWRPVSVRLRQKRSSSQFDLLLNFCHVPLRHASKRARLILVQQGEMVQFLHILNLKPNNVILLICWHIYNQKWVDNKHPRHTDKTGCLGPLVIRSCYRSPAVLQHRNSSVPPAARIVLHFQSLKERLINSIIQPSIFMA